MTLTAHLNEKWIKASILGTIWASSEIVLGSFLHNLRVPFSGNILTAIALVILISASYKWKENGLFWRAGVICALLKTMSPSAVIFGPMIAIFSESVLLELSTRLLGKSIPGYILGSALAMSWNLFQKIFNFIIFYGYNIVEVYTNLMKYAEKQLFLKFDAVWAPIVLLLILYALFGVVSAIIGIRTGKKIVSNPLSNSNFIHTANNHFSRQQKQNGFNHSKFWLALNVILIAGTLFLVGRIHFVAWAAMVFVIATAWAVRYKRALRQIARPRLWIFFVVVTMITAFVLTRMQSEPVSAFVAIQTGIEMNLRAIILIMGFTVLGTELYNPEIREYFGKTYFRQLPAALELSLDSLPAMIANTPDVKTILRNPVTVVHHLIGYAESRLDNIRQNSFNKPKIFIITGKIGSGKTTLIQKLIQKFRFENILVSGIYSARILENDKTTGYDVVDISTDETEKFLRDRGNEDQQRIGKFYIDSNGEQKGNEILMNSQSKLIIIDEIGKLELEDRGWAHSLEQLVTDSKSNLLLSVREEVLYEVTEKFKISPDIIFNVEAQKDEDLFSLILNELPKHS
ncbi:MAG TPA: nucleoside-triphosphatase [Draconibacterium sp.]|jgi:nucleoside-triphosphatase THEP1|nr:nucleoside-triphosphatase [Draconibacterium sp.]